MKDCPGIIASLTFAKEKRIRKRRDFLRVQGRGMRIFGRFIVIVAQNDSSGRIGITVPKKVGAAHVRNKVKRRIRHTFRHKQDLFAQKALVIIARPAAALISFAELSQDIINTCARIRFEKRVPTFRRTK